MRYTNIKSFGVVAAGVVGLAAIGRSAKASFIVNFVQSGSGVTATGTGTFNTAGLTPDGSGGGAPVLAAAGAELGLGAPAAYSNYSGISGPSSFGTGTSGNPTSDSGPQIFLFGEDGNLAVPTGLNATSVVTASDTWSGGTFANLGLTPGTYLYTWGSGGNADSYTLQIGPASAVPEPASLSLLGFGALGLLRRRSRRAVAI